MRIPADKAATATCQVSCSACGAVHPIRLSLGIVPADGCEVHVRVHFDASERVLARLFAEAHRGPIVPGVAG